MKTFAIIISVLLMFSVNTQAAMIECSTSIPVPPVYSETVFEGDSITYYCSEYTDGTNRAISGYKAANVLTVVQGNLENDAGKRYHFLVGINDILFPLVYDEEVYISTMTDILNLITDEVVVMSTILPITGYPSLKDTIISANTALATLAGQYDNVTIRDMYTAFLDPEDPESGNLNPAYHTPPDGVHLNDTGCAALYEGY